MSTQEEIEKRMLEKVGLLHKKHLYTTDEPPSNGFATRALIPFLYRFLNPPAKAKTPLET